MSVEATPVDLWQKFEWALEIDGFNAALFTECDPPDSEIEKVEFAQAGTLHNTKFPGRRMYSDIVAKKGVFKTGADDAAHDWFVQGANTDDGTAVPPSQLLRDVNLHRLDGQGNIITTWELIGAWICKLSYEKLEAKSSDFTYESFTLCYQRYTRTNG